MRSLLHDYLTQSDSRNALYAVPNGLHNVIHNIVAPRDRSKVGGIYTSCICNVNLGQIIFKLTNTVNTASDFKQDQEDLQQILKASVPGLVSESLRPAVTSADSNNASDGAATGHKLLIEPSVFNIGLLLPPSLAFLGRIKEIVPSG